MPKPKRHRALAFLMLAPAILLFAIGWALYFFGEGKGRRRTKKKNVIA
ncbi:MAG: hypothetical protein ABSB71_07795 [Candidatus Bathyarchaeia archaeon]|jgi:hypothetical protein